MPMDPLPFMPMDPLMPMDPRWAKRESRLAGGSSTYFPAYRAVLSYPGAPPRNNAVLFCYENQVFNTSTQSGSQVKVQVARVQPFPLYNP